MFWHDELTRRAQRGAREYPRAIVLEERHQFRGTNTVCNSKGQNAPDRGPRVEVEDIPQGASNFRLEVFQEPGREQPTIPTPRQRQNPASAPRGLNRKLIQVHGECEGRPVIGENSSFRVT